MGEQRAVISELKEGMELARQLQLHLNSASSAETRDFLVQRILSTYENALLALKCSQTAVKAPKQPAELAVGLPESPIPPDESPQSEIMGNHQQRQDASKKRKTLPRRTDYVKVSPESGMEGPLEDGYSWRKYGQKDILRAKYPRSYYRCTYRHMHNCWATKLVQRSDDDPTIFEVTYKGAHTCNQVNNLPAPVPASPAEREPNQESFNRQSWSEEVLWNFRPDLSIDIEDLDNKEISSPFSFAPFASVENEELMFDFPASYATPFISPATSESNYLSLSCRESGSVGKIILGGQHAESDHAEIISANTSTANSPMFDLDLLTEPLDFGNFPFGNPGFFS